MLRNFCKLGVLVLGLAVCTHTAGNTKVNVTVNRVIDGDTFEIIVPELPIELQKIHIRVHGIDTPEKSKHLARCQKEIDLANIARDEVKRLIEHKNVTIEIIGHDKYGGRVLGNVQYGSLSIKQFLLDKGLAVTYNGSGPKHLWC
jgi:endonuclease YncB( thermonuclease family)